MKKFFAVAALILGVVVSQLVAPPQAQAEDYYLGNWEGGWKAYWVIESTKLLDGSTKTAPRFSCQVKAVSAQGTVKYIDYVMLIELLSSNGDGRISFKDSLGGQGTFYSNNVGVYQVESKLAMGLIALLVHSMDSR